MSSITRSSQSAVLINTSVLSKILNFTGTFVFLCSPFKTDQGPRLRVVLMLALNNISIMTKDIDKQASWDAFIPIYSMPKSSVLWGLLNITSKVLTPFHVALSLSCYGNYSGLCSSINSVRVLASIKVELTQWNYWPSLLVLRLNLNIKKSTKGLKLTWHNTK